MAACQLDMWYKIQLIAELMSSSEDSDSEEDNYNVLLPLVLSVRKKPKVSNFIENIVFNYSDQEFRENFRMSRETCCKLVHGFQSSTYYPNKELDKGGKRSTSAEKHLLAFLWFAGNKCVIREVSQLFDISLSTFVVICTRVMDYLLSISKDIIKFPQNEDELTAAAQSFQEVSGFPNVVGCIDGTYINMSTPCHKIKSTYVNRHHQTALTLQGICDHRKRFIDAFTGTSSKMHDARVFKCSFISNSLPAICNNQFHILGDSAYPITPYLITPYRDYGNLNNDQRKFNRRFSSTRVLIENTFGLYKGRFRQLIRTDFHSVLKTSQFILCCCVLHNLCIDNGDVWDEPYEEEVVDEFPDEQPQCRLKRLGEQKRDRICAEFRCLP